MTGLAAGFAGVFGLVFGSFLNVVAYRVPLGRSVVNPPSACPACGAPVRPRDNIPVVSWLLLGGKCRDCAAPISSRYPIVEVLTGALFAATVFVTDINWVLPAYLWFTAVTLVLILTDLDHKRIPNRILYPGTVVGVLLLAIGAVLDSQLSQFGRGALGGLLYFAGLFLLALIARGGFGFGDVKLAFLLGLFMAFRGWEHLVVGIFLAFFIGGLISIALLVSRRRGRKDAIPFGPSLVLGAWIGIVYGLPIADWYLGI
ncbi:MAG: prepilin peptidase [Acidimicrobiia bacterium]|nr:prepilin peptidase [Acidimicrobiia bacterium]